MLTHLQRNGAVTMLLFGVAVVLLSLIAASIYLVRPAPPPPEDATLVMKPAAAALTYTSGSPWHHTDKGESGPGRKSTG